MACIGNMPGFKYVTVESLVITYNGIPYPIKIFVTNKKYIVWNIDRPYQLEDTNVRPESSLLEYLIVINDNGKPTIVEHEELLYSFNQTTNGSNLTGSTEYNTLKSQVDKNTTKFNLVSNTVDDLTQIIGTTEELEDGTIIYNLNKVKSDSKSYGISIGEIETKIDDKYAEIKPIILNDLIEYLRSVSEYKLSFTNILEDTLITEEELSLINTNKTNILDKSTKIQNTLSDLKVIVDSISDVEKSQLVAEMRNKLSTIQNVLISMCDSYLQDSKISGEEKTNIIQKVYELATYIGTVQNTCSNITVNGQGGVIYSVENELLMLKDSTTSSIKELNRDDNTLREGISEVKQTANDISSKVSSVETATDSIKNQVTQNKQNVRCNDLGGKINYSDFSTSSNGKIYLHGYDANNNPTDTDGIIYWNGVSQKITKGVINPNSYFGTSDCYLCTTVGGNGTFIAYYNEGWKYRWLIGSTSVGSVELNTTYITFGQFKIKNTGVFEYAYLYSTPIKLENAIGISNIETRLSTAEQKITDDAIISTVQSTINTAKTEAINSANGSTDTKLKDYATTTSLSTVSQTANKINWIVKSGTSSSDMALTDNALSVIANNINLTGKVSFSSFDSTLTNKINSIQNTTDIVNSNKINWTNAYSRVNEWAYNSIEGKTTINGGLIQANTIIAEQIAIGDFNNYVVLPPNSTFQGSSGNTTGYEISSIVGSEKYNNEHLTNKLYGINGGDKFRVNAFVKSDTVGARLDITCCWRNVNNELITSSSVYNVTTTANAWEEINEIITVPSRPSGASYVRFKINIQAEQSRRVYIERLSITRMYDGELIVDGAITGIKISADAIDGRLIKGAIIVGGEMRGSSNFFTAPNDSAVEGYGFRIYSTGQLYSTGLMNISDINSPTTNFCSIYPSGYIHASKYMNVGTGVKVSGQSLWLGIRDIALGSESNFNLELTQQADSNVYFRPGYNGQVILGHPAKLFNTVYSVNGTSSSSDRTLKENIQYLGETENSKAIVSEDLSELDLYNFVKDDLVTAKFNFIGDDKEQVGFIAQDLLYSLDGGDNRVGQLIVNKPDDKQSPLTYNEKIYTNVLAGALRHAILKIEELENKINN